MVILYWKSNSSSVHVNFTDHGFNFYRSNLPGLFIVKKVTLRCNHQCDYQKKELLLSGIIMFNLFFWISNFSKLFPYKHMYLYDVNLFTPGSKKLKKLDQGRPPISLTEFSMSRKDTHCLKAEEFLGAKVTKTLWVSFG